jgi:hypothetical protein
MVDLLNEAQHIAVSKMHNGCILCGDVGSGKSRTSLAYYYICQGGDLTPDDQPHHMTNPQDLYIITTAKKRDTSEWDMEMAHFLLSQDSEKSFYQNTVVVDSWNNIEKYKDVTNAFFIFDEQRVVGKGKWVKTFLKIAKQNNWILLSATPGDKWEDYIPVFVANGFYKNRTEFTQNHLIFANYTDFPKIVGYVGTKRLAKLRDSLLVDIPVQRHTVAHHETIYVDYDQQLYRDVNRNRWNPFTDAPIQNASEYCYCLRRLVNTDTSRQVKLLEIIEHNPRTIIFYNLDCEREVLLSCLSSLEPLGYEIAECNGKKHDAVPSGDKWCYLVQYMAGAEGWNCVSTNCIIFYSPNYSYRIMKQAAGRIDRMNTKYVDLWYYHLQTHSGIDNSIAKALREKKKFNESSFSKSFFGESTRKG